MDSGSKAERPLEVYRYSALGAVVGMIGSAGTIGLGVWLLQNPRVLEGPHGMSAAQMETVAYVVIAIFGLLGFVVIPYALLRVKARIELWPDRIRQITSGAVRLEIPYDNIQDLVLVTNLDMASKVLAFKLLDPDRPDTLVPQGLAGSRTMQAFTGSDADCMIVLEGYNQWPGRMHKRIVELANRARVGPQVQMKEVGNIPN